MALTDIQQLHKLIENSKNILLVFGPEKNDDYMVSAVALKLFLEKQQKQVEIASPDFTIPRHLRFLPHLDIVRPNLANLQKMVIKVDISKAKLETVSYEVKENTLSIYLNPKSGVITKDDLRTAQTSFKYDLIITIGIRDLDSLGNIFFHNTDLFYHTPIVNFDYHASNEHFGQINAVEINATSNAEIVFKAMEQLGSAFIDEKIATCLLTGMISQTRSFKTPNVTPHTLNIASRLMSMGADREKIVHNLYRTRSIATLKLWGSALTNLQTDRSIGLVWTAITREDFARSGTSEDDLKDIVSELIANSPEAKLILILNESSEAGQGQKIKAFLATDKDYNATELLQQFHAEGNKKTAVAVLENLSLKEAEEKIIDSIKENII